MKPSEQELSKRVEAVKHGISDLMKEYSLSFGVNLVVTNPIGKFLLKFIKIKSEIVVDDQITKPNGRK